MVALGVPSSVCINFKAVTCALLVLFVPLLVCMLVVRKGVFEYDQSLMKTLLFCMLTSVQ